MTTSLTPRRQAAALAQVHESLERARVAATQLRTAATSAKDNALRAAATALRERTDELLELNAADVQAGADAGLSEGVLDRLRLTKDGIVSLARGLDHVADMPDPVDEVLREDSSASDGRTSQLLRLPLGVVGVVYEAQPAVTVEISGLVIKAGNAVLLRGGQAAAQTDLMLAEVLRTALDNAGLPADGMQLVSSTQRSSIQHLITARGRVDLIVLRGGRSLIRSAGSDARVPTVELGPNTGHIYVDDDADLALATRVVFDSKLRQPALPHAVRTVLVHESVAPKLLPDLVATLREASVTVLGDQRVRALVGDVAPVPADDWHSEYHALEIAIAVVDSLDDASIHINRFGSGSPHVIVTENEATARTFVGRLNTASVRINLPTGIADADGTEAGGLFATQKLHANGAIHPEVFTTTKWVTWPSSGLGAA